MRIQELLQFKPELKVKKDDEIETLQKIIEDLNE
jgi:hypothetical protein